jgi:hypothetical protein
MAACHIVGIWLIYMYVCMYVCMHIFKLPPTTVPSTVLNVKIPLYLNTES